MLILILLLQVIDLGLRIFHFLCLSSRFNRSLPCPNLSWLCCCFLYFLCVCLRTPVLVCFCEYCIELIICTIKNLLTTWATQHRNKYDKSGVYQLECPSCNKKYIGQTGRPFKTRYQEHYRDYKHGSMKSKFVQHLLENQHHIDSIDNIMDILRITNKGKMMDTIEKFYIYRETMLNNQINDKLTVKPNVIFETLVRQDPHRGIPAARNPQSTT